MPSLFFKSYWNIVGEDVVATVQDFFITGTLYPYINSSNIVLVPKSQSPSMVNHFRPIAVCNVIYKVISKLLADRVKPLLNQLICPTQKTFVPGRSIHDNSVLIQEIIHAMKRKRGSQGCMGLKIDLRKAYDRLSWKFLEAVLRAYGFHPQWIHWVITCFTLNRHSSTLHHLFFVDDIFLIGKCSVNVAFYFKECLDAFCNWFDQSFNPQKSNIFFNATANRQSASLISAMMGFSKINPNSPNLGLLLFRSGKTRDFHFLVEHLDSKLAGWKAKTLLKAKTLVLIKSIALTIPIYSMQTVKLPVFICSKLDARIRSFWWNSNSSNGKTLCFKAWDDLCKLKGCGGLGFRKMMDFNISLLAKWSWNLLTGRRFLCLDFLRSKYLHSTAFNDTTPKRFDSCFWKAILQIRGVVKEGACYVVGDGCSIDPWKDPWVPRAVNFMPQIIAEPGVDNGRVKDFFMAQ
ncbi:hypothetical protein UlMin_035996 [Ulmus minor]